MTRPATRPLGQAGEAVAARFLAERGLTILARNVRSPYGEIDLVAEDGPTLVFVEVKARQGGVGDPPQAAVDARKRARLGRLALGYLRHAGRPDRRCRFDVVAVTFERAAAPADTPGGAPPRVQYFPDAFTVEGFWS